MKTVWFWAETC